MTRRLTIILFLTALWLALTGAPDVSNLVLGLLLGMVIVYLMPRPERRGAHRIRPGAVLVLIPVFVWNVLRASIRVAIHILTPRPRLRPAVVAVPLEARSNLQATVIANMISLMPGTLALDHDEEGTTLFVHILHVPGDDVERARAEIRDRIERPLLRAVEYRG